MTSRPNHSYTGKHVWPLSLPSQSTHPTHASFISHESCSYIAVFTRTVVQYVSQLLTLFLVRGFFYPEDGGDKLLRNVVLTMPTRHHISEDGTLQLGTLLPAESSEVLGKFQVKILSRLHDILTQIQIFFVSKHIPGH